MSRLVLDPRSLLNQANVMFVNGEKRYALEMLTQALDMVQTTDFSELMLAAVELVDCLEPDILEYLLSYTNWFKGIVVYRDWLFAAVMSRYMSDPSRAHRVRRLLGGLEGPDVNPWA